MLVHRLDDPAAFLGEASPLLLQDEARHNLLLGLAATLRDHPSLYPEHRLWRVRADGGVVGAASRTPPQNFVLARPRLAGAVEALGRSAIDADLPGGTGAVPEVEAFAARVGRGGRTGPPRGHPRGRAGPSGSACARSDARRDRGGPVAPPRLVARVRARGARRRTAPSHVARAVDHRLAGGGAGAVLWERGDRPVALAAFGGATPNGIRSGPVSTPPEERGRGFPTALVAALSARLLAAGRRFCFLYADLANPTANRIYRRIGYELVCESAEIHFSG